MKYKLLIHSIRGPVGDIVEIDPSEAETIAILTRNGIIGAPLSEREPEVVKVDAPEVKKRGRPRNASDAAE
jgi:hypothetical protein